MAGARWSAAEDAWLIEHYGSMGCGQATVDALNAACGNDRNLHGMRTHAHKLGLHVYKPREQDRVCERMIRWSREPEMSAWMREHDKGQRIEDVKDAFEAEFGFRITTPQVSTFRGLNGTRRRHVKGHPEELPVGTIRDTSKGYRIVKARPKPDVPGSKDNWEPVKKWVWEQANGPLPEGYVVVAANRDPYDERLENLLAIPMASMAYVNSMDWHDVPTLQAAVDVYMVQSRVLDYRMRPRKCQRCGKEFVPKMRDFSNCRTQTCPECVAAGYKAVGVRRADKGRAVCAVCGAEFDKEIRTQRRCRSCIDAAPKAAVSQQAKEAMR